VRVAPGQSNIVIANVEGRRASDVAAALRARGVLVLALDLTTLRLTTHHDVSRADCERAAAEIQTVLGHA
jgi:threonine aldolase